MTFHELYGELPTSTLRLIRRAKVTPAEFYDFEYMGMTFPEMETHILSHMVNGAYRHPLPM